MSLRFRKTKKILPGFSLNFGKRGISLSMGRKGAKVTTGARGTSASVGIPGSGLSYRKNITSKSRSTSKSEHDSEVYIAPKRKSVIRWYILSGFFVFGAIGSIFNKEGVSILGLILSIVLSGLFFLVAKGNSEINKQVAEEDMALTESENYDSLDT